VKIDRSFLEGIDTDRPLTLLRGVARLSADLGHVGSWSRASRPTSNWS